MTTHKVPGDIRQRVEDEMAAEKRLMRRFGDRLERKWADDPNGPRLPAVNLIRRFIIAEVEHRRGRPTESDKPEPDDARAALMQVIRARSELEQTELSALTAARRLGLTWREIAECVGLDSPQAAQQRYARLGGRVE